MAAVWDSLVILVDLRWSRGYLAAIQMNVDEVILDGEVEGVPLAIPGGDLGILST
jgi:hypothetical protein